MADDETEQEHRVVQLTGVSHGKSKDGPKEENETRQEEVTDGQV